MVVWHTIRQNAQHSLVLSLHVSTHEHPLRLPKDFSIENLPISIKAHQFLCGCPNKGGPPGAAGSAVLAWEKASINSGLKGSNTTTPTWSWRSCQTRIQKENYNC